MLNKVAPFFPTMSKYKLVVGTRNVVLDSPEKEGFHGTEAYRFEVAEQISPHMENGMQVFGEIVGFVNGKSVMPNGDVKALKDKNYTEKYGDTNVFHYGCKEHEYKFHIYRVTREDVNGNNIDMSQKEMEQWCKDRELPCTFEVHQPIWYDGYEESLRVLVEFLTESELSEDHEFKGMLGEGIILRVESGKMSPDFYKSKSYAFRVMEGISEVVDEETVS